jgi:hypothetical protein
MIVKFVVVYMPFPDSDETATREEWGKDEDDVLQQFRTNYPLWRVKSVVRSI